MAIRFVDKGPEHKPAEGVKRPKPEAAPAVAAASKTSPADVDPPALPQAEPAPRPSGRKRSASVPAADRAVTMDAPAQATLDGVLPRLPHPKPDPKPRGRKKAFG